MKLVDEVNSLTKEKSEGQFNIKDSLIQDLSYEELIDTITSNEKIMDENAVKKVFKELLNGRVNEAKSELKSNMKRILQEIK